MNLSKSLTKCAMSKIAKPWAKIMVRENVRQEGSSKREPVEKTKLVEEYREVGPAAINAALLCKPKKKEAPKRLYEAREEA